MGLFSKRQKRQSRRALRRAHTKALKAQAVAERKFAAKNAKKAARAAKKKGGRAVESGRRSAATAAAGLATTASSAASTASSAASTAASGAAHAPAAALDARATKKAAKQRKKESQAAAKAEAKKQLSAAKVRRYIGIARVVIPVLSPLAYQAATRTRGTLDARRARAIGVDVENLTEFTGHGAGLSARIRGLESSIAELDRGQVGAAGTEAAAAASHDRAFATSSQERLAELSTAVHAAERMPTPRRRKAHAAIGSELDRIDGELLRRLGVR